MSLQLQFGLFYSATVTSRLSHNFECLMGVFYLARTPEVQELLLLNTRVGSVVSGKLPFWWAPRCSSELPFWWAPRCSSGSTWLTYSLQASVFSGVSKDNPSTYFQVFPAISMSNAVRTLNPVLVKGNTTINNNVSTALISQLSPPTTP